MFSSSDENIAVTSFQGDVSRVNMFRGFRRMESQPDFNLCDESESADVIYMDECDAGDSMRQ